jgi:hypothetical protein
MQADARRMMNNRIESPFGLGSLAPPVICTHRQPHEILLARPTFPLFKFSARLSQTQGWAMKAHEFIDSGPPALLNNPCCCRRVVCGSFLNRVTEVQYG